MRVTFTSRGDLRKTERWLNKLSKLDIRSVLESVGKDGVAALAAATPADSGLAGMSWTYEVKTTRTGSSVTWHNTNVESGFPVAIMIQLGYGTGTGGYVAGRDYINPAMRPVFDNLLAQIERAVKAA